MAPHLFEPLSLREITLPNRIVVSPMGQHSADDGVVADWHLMHLGQFAVSGAGLVFTEAVAVTPAGRVSPYDIGLWTDEQAEALTRIVDFARRYGGAVMGVQLNHSGRKGSVAPAWEGHEALKAGGRGWQPEAPSAAGYPGRNAPVALDDAGLARTRKAFADAARRADAAGFEVIELHSAHGYLLHNFLSPLANRRSDAYGGSLANRMRFPLAVFDAVRAVWPTGKALGVRVSATDWIEGGWSLADTITYAAELKARGCDFICASSGGTAPEQTIAVKPLYQVPFAQAIREAIGIATIAVGLIKQPREAEGILAAGQADLVALARGMLANPRWAWDAAEQLGASAFYPKQYDRAHPAMRNNDSFGVRHLRQAG
jgi:NADPH2 dehydrogenase